MIDGLSRHLSIVKNSVYNGPISPFFHTLANENYCTAGSNHDGNGQVLRVHYSVLSVGFLFLLLRVEARNLKIRSARALVTDHLV